MDNKLPIVVLNLNEENALSKFLLGEKVGTLIQN
jgi:uridylate kinase